MFIRIFGNAMVFLSSIDIISTSDFKRNIDDFYIGSITLTLMLLVMKWILEHLQVILTGKNGHC